MFQSGMVEVADQDWWPEWLPANGMRELIPLLAIVLVLYFRGSRLPVRGSIIQRRQPLALATKRAWIGVVIGVVLVAILSNTFTAQWEVALTTSLVAGMIMLSSVVLIGFLGQISLAQTALAGVAAYTAIRFASDGTLGPFDLVAVDGPGWPAPIAFVLGVAAAVIVGLLVGLPALRIRGVQLAIVTLAAVGPIGNLLLQNQSIYSAAAGGHHAGAEARVVRRLRVGDGPDDQPDRLLAVHRVRRARLRPARPGRRQPAPRRHRAEVPGRAGQRAGRRGGRDRRGPHQDAGLRHRLRPGRHRRHLPGVPVGWRPGRVLQPVRGPGHPGLRLPRRHHLGLGGDHRRPDGRRRPGLADHRQLRRRRLQRLPVDHRRHRPDPHGHPQPGGDRHRHVVDGETSLGQGPRERGRARATVARAQTGGTTPAPVAP